jgi:aryl-alcohol dehydrogenase-like predicted oxidoreductase
MEKRALGNQGLRTSAIGLGCMGMSEYYGRTDWDRSTATIHHALEVGVSFLDTADIYGQGHNEVLVGRAMATSGVAREEIQLATKFGIDRSGGDQNRRIRGEAAYVQRSCEASLMRLGVDWIDIYYLHRPPQDVPLEETVAAMASLVEQGKVRHLGLSEAWTDTIRRAHATHPISALQSEYSLWTREQDEVLPVLRELGIGLVPYSPLGRGFLTGTIRSVADFDDDDMRRTNPRFAEENFRANLAAADEVRAVADDAGCTPAQAALAWVLSKGSDIAPIPGTKRVSRLEENVAADAVTLTPEQLSRLDAATPAVGGHHSESQMKLIER